MNLSATGSRRVIPSCSMFHCGSGSDYLGWALESKVLFGKVSRQDLTLEAAWHVIDVEGRKEITLPARSRRGAVHTRGGVLQLHEPPNNQCRRKGRPQRAVARRSGETGKHKERSTLRMYRKREVTQLQE
jgi:hypothetical protein